MRYDYDVGVIGLGPAGMAVAVMASHMGLRVLAVERRALGGECMNVGCIPSKSLLQMAHLRHMFSRAPEFALSPVDRIPDPVDPFQRLGEHIRFINERKTTKMFEKVDLKLREGSASFVAPHEITLDGGSYTAKRFFICTGTQPAVPPIPGLSEVNFLTNETVFRLDGVPDSMVIIGGGAIGCEMAQAFSRLGSKVTILHLDKYLLPHGDGDAGRQLEDVFAREGIAVHHERSVRGVGMEDGLVVVSTEQGETFRGQRLLVAAGRRHDVSDLHLENAGVEFSARGIHVNRHLRTTHRAIYAPGDCNGAYLFSHAAMHQGMLALMNAIAPWPIRFDYTKYLVPWTVFTDPPVAHVGKLERELQASGTPYEVHEERYEDYGAAIAEGLAIGSVRAYVSKTGRIHGVRIIGHGAGEMINEWGLAIQNKLRLHKIMFLQHSFPSMSFLSKRVSERWMMKRMDSRFLQSMVRWLY
jgi:pyruvate/2-oxoglutarate dehydrogenase complex dihydrolipoamide dehydrogenase (E3) component